MSYLCARGRFNLSGFSTGSMGVLPVRASLFALLFTTLHGARISAHWYGMSKENDHTITCIKICLEPNKAQRAQFASFAGSARWAYNFALAIKIGYQKRWFEARKQFVESGLDEKAAGKKASEQVGRMPNYMSIATNEWTQLRDEVCPWYPEVPRRVFVGGFQRADAAFKNWFDSKSGRRSGAAVGWPKFKSKSKSRESFVIASDIQPSFVANLNRYIKTGELADMDYRHIKVPKCGEVRLTPGSAGQLRQLGRTMLAEAKSGELITRITSGTISRLGDRWYVSLVISGPFVPDAIPTKRQRRNGVVGVDLGSGRFYATTSEGLSIINPKFVSKYEQYLARANRALAKTAKGSAARKKALARLRRVHARSALARDGFSHQVSAWLTSQFAGVAVEKFDLASMLASAKGTVEKPGKNVDVKARFNAHLADVGIASTIDKLFYKGKRDGCRVQVVNTLDNSSTTCAKCGHTCVCGPEQKTFTCPDCGYSAPRQLNSAQYIRQLATVGFDELGLDMTASLTPDTGKRPIAFMASAH